MSSSGLRDEGMCLGLGYGFVFSSGLQGEYRCLVLVYGVG